MQYQYHNIILIQVVLVLQSYLVWYQFHIIAPYILSQPGTALAYFSMYIESTTPINSVLATSCLELTKYLPDDWKNIITNNGVDKRYMCLPIRCKISVLTQQCLLISPAIYYGMTAYDDILPFLFHHKLFMTGRESTEYECHGAASGC